MVSDWLCVTCFSFTTSLFLIKLFSSRYKISFLFFPCGAYLTGVDPEHLSISITGITWLTMFFMFHDDHYHVTNESRATEYCIRNQFAAFPLLLKWKTQCSMNRRNWILDKIVLGKTVMWRSQQPNWYQSQDMALMILRWGLFPLLLKVLWFYCSVNTVKLICMTLGHKLYCICNFFSKTVQNTHCELGTNVFALNTEVNRTNLFIYFFKTAPLS